MIGGEADVPTCVEEWAEQCGYWLALRYRVGRHERKFASWMVLEVISGFLVPARDVVEVSGVVFAPDDLQVFLLVCCLEVLPDEGRIPCAVDFVSFGNDVGPVGAQRVAYMDVGAVEVVNW